MNSRSGDYYQTIKTLNRKKAKRKQKLKRRRINQGSVINKHRYRPKKPQFGNNINYLVSTGKVLIPKRKCKSSVLKVPHVFSLTQNSNESFEFIYTIFSILYYDCIVKLELDYSNCETIDLDAQVFMDVILKEFVFHYKKCNAIKYTTTLKEIAPVNFDREYIKRILYSIGSFKILRDVNIQYPDLIPYELCIGNKKMKGTSREVASQKEVHTTMLIDYVIDSLARLDKRLNPEALSNLCQVVGEVLINAEEHSTTSQRFSIGYFEEVHNASKNYGVFNLVIFNFGQTIYQKFKDPDCPTKHIVKRMSELSDKYTNKGWFKKTEFEEETLWTLYALQDGVTSKDNYKKRGNGSIRFIESFIDLKGFGLFKDSVSSMNIISGNTRIHFDGTYEPVEVERSDNNKYKVITFNRSNTIEDKPDKNFVKFADEFFPGTMIAAKILIEENDLDKNYGNKIHH